MNNIKLFTVTLMYLRFIQIYFRLYYLVRTRLRSLQGFSYPLAVPSQHAKIVVEESIFSVDSLKEERFTFLNRSHSFSGPIEWNFSEYGKLWTYNLAYFEYLNQKNISRDEGLKLINSFIDQSDKLKDALEPFPISLRALNWIKFILHHDVQSQKIDDSLYAQYKILMDNLEYHILGNHLLENGFSLLFGAYYFNDAHLHAKAKEILVEELDEQILKDGAHFELSPMYHQIMLFRVLDCINLLQNNRQGQDRDFLEFLQNKASLMLGWLKKITFNDGSIPLLNDSANGIAPKSSQLLKYAARLNITVQEIALKECGYRKFKNNKYECIVDVGDIGPDYIPGHAHADTFSFELHVDNKPFIVDTGISTYETNTRRNMERSTHSHNTVEIEELSQSEVWSSFRVANRANVVALQERASGIKAVHNGYEKKLNALHEREFMFNLNGIKITDRIISDRDHKAVARVHFHPSVDEEMIERHVVLDNCEYAIREYQYAPEFNLLFPAKVLEVEFRQNLEIKIEL